VPFRSQCHLIHAALPYPQVGEWLHESSNEALWYGFQKYGNGQLPGSSSSTLLPEQRVNRNASNVRTDTLTGDSGSSSGSSSSESSRLAGVRTKEVEKVDHYPFAFEGAFSVHADFDEVVGSPESGDLIGHLVQHRGYFYKHKVESNAVTDAQRSRRMKWKESAPLTRIYLSSCKVFVFSACALKVITF